MKKLLASALFLCLLCPSWAWAMMYLDDDQMSQHSAQSGIYFRAGMVFGTEELLVGTNIGTGGGYLGLTNFKLYEADPLDPLNTSNRWDWTWYIDWGTSAGGNPMFYIESRDVGNFAFSVGQIYVVDQNLENPHNVFGLYLFNTNWTDNYFWLDTPALTDTGIRFKFDWAMDGGFLVFGDIDGYPGFGAPGFWGLEDFYFFRSSTYFASGAKSPVTIYNFDVEVGTNAGGQTVLRIKQNGFDDVLMGGRYFMLTNFNQSAKGRLFSDFWLQGLRWTNAAYPNMIEIRAPSAGEGIVVSPRIALMADQLLMGDDSGFAGYGNAGYIKMEGWSLTDWGTGGTIRFGEWLVRAVTDNRTTGTTIDDVSFIEIAWNRDYPLTPVNFGSLIVNSFRIHSNRTLGAGPSMGSLLIISPDLTASTGAGGPYYIRINSPWTGAAGVRPTVQTGLRINARLHATGGILAWYDDDGFAGNLYPTYAGFVNMELSGHAIDAFELNNLDFQIGSDGITTRLFFNLPPTNVRIRADSIITSVGWVNIFHHDFRGTIAITNGQMMGR